MLKKEDNLADNSRNSLFGKVSKGLNEISYQKSQKKQSEIFEEEKSPFSIVNKTSMLGQPGRYNRERVLGDHDDEASVNIDDLGSLNNSMEGYDDNENAATGSFCASQRG